MNAELMAPPVGENTNFKLNLEIDITVTVGWPKITNIIYFIFCIIFRLQIYFKFTN